MKFLKRLLTFILILAAIFFIVGLINPQVNYGHSITVEKPLKEAWAVSQDASKYADWLKGFKSMELLSGEKGKVGSTYKIIVNPGEGQPDFEMIETLNDIKENEFVDMTFVSDMMDFEQKIFFSEKDGKTTIKSESQVKGKQLMMKSMFALMEMFTKGFTKQEAENFEALKVLIDNNETDYFPVQPVMEELVN